MTATSRSPIFGHVQYDTYLALGFLTLFALWSATLLGGLTDSYPRLFTASSIVAYALYAIDKYQAKRNGRRIPECVLHLIEVAGGWPGAAIAQVTLRHKNRKPAYQVMFWLMIAVNAGASLLLHKLA